MLLLQVLVQAGAYVKEEVVRALIVLITNAPELHAYAARSAFRALTSNFNTAAPSLCEACLWCIGEFGEMLPPGVCRVYKMFGRICIPATCMQCTDCALVQASNNLFMCQYLCWGQTVADCTRYGYAFMLTPLFVLLKVLGVVCWRVSLI